MFNNQHDAGAGQTIVGCHCGSENVSRRYVNDNTGEVIGIAYRCRKCGAYDEYA